MMTLFSVFHRKPESLSTRVRRTPEIIRAFVETGDERCPIAGIWSCVGNTDTTLDEPERTRPVMRRLLPWRASHSLFKLVRYSTT